MVFMYGVYVWPGVIISIFGSGVFFYWLYNKLCYAAYNTRSSLKERSFLDSKNQKDKGSSEKRK